MSAAYQMRNAKFSTFWLKPKSVAGVVYGDCSTAKLDTLSISSARSSGNRWKSTKNPVSGSRRARLIAGLAGLANAARPTPEKVLEIRSGISEVFWDNAGSASKS